MEKFLEVGKIVSTHGIKGEVKVQPYTDKVEDLLKIKVLSFDKQGKTLVKVNGHKKVKQMAVLKLEGVDTPEEAQTLVNKRLFASREKFKLDKGVFFIVDLIGLQVEDDDTGEVYGKIIDVTQTGANDVYHIKRPNGGVAYIPAIKDVVVKTDIEEKVMKIRPLAGLFEEE